MEIEKEFPVDTRIIAFLDGLRHMLNGDSLSSQEFKDIFWQAYLITVYGEQRVEKFMEHLHGVLNDHTESAAAAILRLEDETDMLSQYARAWSTFYEFSESMASFGLLEDRAELGYAAKPLTTNSYPIQKMMLETWRLNVFKKVNHRLLPALMNQVNAERSGETINYGEMISVKESYVSLCTDEKDPYRIYTDHFESAYIEALFNYYSDRAKQYLADCGVQAFIIYANQKLSEEYNLAQQHMATSDSVAKVLLCCNNIFVTKFSQQFASECQRLLAANEEEKLWQIYVFIKCSYECRADLALVLEQHIYTTGIARLHRHKVQILRDSSKYVGILLQLINESTNWYENDALLVIAAETAFKLLMNAPSVFTSHLEPKRNEVHKEVLPKPEEKSSVKLATYCDMLLRKTKMSDRLSVAEIKDKLQNMMKLVNYLNNIEAFVEAYKMYLARRLICDTSRDIGLEINTAAELRNIGVPGMSKINHMLQNILGSKELEEMFKASLRSVDEISMAEIFGAKIIHACTWKQTTVAIPVSLPAEIEAPILIFKQFYTSIYPDRKLNFSYAMTRAVINLKSDVGTFELEVTAYQLAILCAWNDQVQERQSLHSLQLETLLQDSELRKVLWSLVASDKVQEQVLCYSPAVQNAGGFDHSSTFWLNRGFFPMMNNIPLKGRINLAGPLLLAPQKPDAEDQKAILQLRNSHLQEAILKSIETNGCVCQAELQMMVAQLLKPMFRPSKELITEQVEWLVRQNIIRSHSNGWYERLANNS